MVRLRTDIRVSHKPIHTNTATPHAQLQMYATKLFQEMQVRVAQPVFVLSSPGLIRGLFSRRSREGSTVHCLWIPHGHIWNASLRPSRSRSRAAQPVITTLRKMITTHHVADMRHARNSPQRIRHMRQSGVPRQVLTAASGLALTWSMPSTPAFAFSRCTSATFRRSSAMCRSIVARSNSCSARRVDFATCV